MANTNSVTSEMNKQYISGKIEYNGQIYEYDFVYDKNNPNVGLDVFYHGFHRGSDTANYMRNDEYGVGPIFNTYKTSQSSGLIVYHDYSKNGSDYLEACDLIVEDISKKYGINFSNINRSGASYGDNYALASGIKYNLENDVTSPNFISLYADRIWESGNPFSGTNNGYINTLTQEKLHQALGNTYLVAYGNNESIDKVKDYTAGVILVEGPGLDHDNGYKTAMNLNAIDFANGYGDLTNIKDYSISYYSGGTGWIRNISLSELKRYLPDMSQEAKSTYYLEAGSSIDIIKSDGSFLGNEISDISGLLKSTRINNTTVSMNSYVSTTDVPSAEPEIIMKMLNACKILFEKIYTELVMINEIGDEFARMDNFLADISEKLSMNVQSTKIPSVKLEATTEKEFNYEIPEEIITKTNKLKEEYGVPITDSTDDTSTSDKPSNNPSASGSGSYVPHTSGGSSGSNTSTGENPNKEPSKEEIPKDEPSKNEPPKEEPPKEEIPKDEPSKDEPSQEEKPSTSNPNTSKPSTSNKPSTSKKPSISKPSTSKPNTSQEEKPPIVEIPDEPLKEEPIIPEEPIVDIPASPQEPEIPNSGVIPETQENDSKLGDTLKTIGGLAGIGAAVGAGVYATHKVLENKENKEERENEYNDYDYESQYSTEETSETDDAQITPFVTDDIDSEGDNK